jgi:hypothetical protein
VYVEHPRKQPPTCGINTANGRVPREVSASGHNPIARNGDVFDAPWHTLTIENLCTCNKKIPLRHAFTLVLFSLIRIPCFR